MAKHQAGRGTFPAPIPESLSTSMVWAIHCGAPHRRGGGQPAGKGSVPANGQRWLLKISDVGENHQTNMGVRAMKNRGIEITWVQATASPDIVAGKLSSIYQLILEARRNSQEALRPKSGQGQA